jgi:hypothetical protein
MDPTYIVVWAVFAAVGALIGKSKNRVGAGGLSGGSMPIELGVDFGLPDSGRRPRSVSGENRRRSVWKTFFYALILIPINLWGQPTISSNGISHFILTSGSTPYGFGSNELRALGDGTDIYNRQAPVPVGVGVIGTIRSLSAGAAYTGLAVTADGKLWAWGGSRNGEKAIIMPDTRPVRPFVMVPSGVARAFTGDNTSRLNLWLTTDGNLGGDGRAGSRQ